MTALLAHIEQSIYDEENLTVEAMEEDWHDDPALVAQCRRARALAGPGGAEHAQFVGYLGEMLDGQRWPTQPPSQAAKDARIQDVFADDREWFHLGSGETPEATWSTWSPAAAARHFGIAYIRYADGREETQFFVPA